MLDYFKRLFQYNAWAQERILAALEKIDPAAPPDSAELRRLWAKGKTS